MSKLFSRKNIVIICVVLVVVIGGVVSWRIMNEQDKNSELEGLVRLENYNHVEEGDITCLALTPECGHCPGKIVDKNCYADPKTAERYR